MKKRKITAALLAVCTLLSVTACADKTSTAEDSTAAATTTTAAETTSAQTDSTTDADAAPETTGRKTESTKTDAESGTTAPAESTKNDQSTQVTQSTRSTQSIQNGTTAPSTTSQQQTTRTSTVSQPAGETSAFLKTLRSFSESGEIAYLMPAGGSNIAVQVRSGAKETVYIVDTAADKITAKVPIANYAWTIGVSKAGEIIAEVYDDREYILVYDIATGKRTARIPYYGDAYEIRYDREHDQIYGTRDQTALKISRTGYDSLAYKMPQTDSRSTVNQYFAPQGLVLNRRLSNEIYSGVEYAMVSIDTGKELYTLPGCVSDFRLTERAAVRVDRERDENGKTVDNAFAFDRSTGRELGRYLLTHDIYCDFASDPAAAQIMVLNNGAGDEWKPTGAALVDAVTGKRENLDISFKNAVSQNACYLPEAGVWVHALSTKKNGKTTTALTTADPAQAKFASAAKSAYPVGLAAPKKQLGAALADKRRRADAIEQRFGIRILIGNEVTQTAGCGSFRLVSTEDSSYYSYWEGSNTEDLDRALDYVERELARYPAGFFEKFKTGDIGGFRLMLTLDLPPADASMQNFGAAGGVAYQNGPFYEVALNTSMCYSYDKSIHHELFHTVEHRLQDLGIEFDYYTWSQLNPKGFSYLSLDNYAEANGKYIMLYYDDNPRENVYFARNYGFSNEMEDRATIMERVFETIYDPETDAMVSGYELVLKHPHLKAKLDEMAKLVKEGFGSVYWEDIYKVGNLNDIPEDSGY